MVSLRIRGVAAACSVAAVLLAVPAESSAFDALDRLFGWGAYRTYRVPYATYYGGYYSTYRVPYVAYSAASCAPSCTPCVTQTCRYVPQTCYRTVCRRVPVTTFQAVAGCDPCTGCPVTTYRPVTTWTTQTQMVPYTTYRLVYSNPCAVSSVCAPSGTSVGTVTSDGSCCGATPAPTYTAPQPTGTPDTFEKNQDPTTNGNIEPKPDPNSGATSAGPIISPDRTTSVPVRRASYFHLLSTPSEPASRPQTPLAPQTSPANVGGWRASTH